MCPVGLDIACIFGRVRRGIFTHARKVRQAVNRSCFVQLPACSLRCALAKQFWFSVHADPLKKDDVPPRITVAQLEQTYEFSHMEDKEERERLEAWVKKKASGLPFMEPYSGHRDYDVWNVSISRCYSCNEIAIWLDDRIVWPQAGVAPDPNSDLPEEIQLDYQEASTILDLSPRGAAALLRLAIQKLCVHLGGKGKNLNEDIGSLVEKGLDQRVRQSLDVVRVIGNNAVHPGELDLRDDRPTAENLFGLVNLIADIMITQPKHVSEMYDSLPEKAREAVQKRDGE